MYVITRKEKRGYFSDSVACEKEEAGAGEFRCGGGEQRELDEICCGKGRRNVRFCVRDGDWEEARLLAAGEVNDCNNVEVIKYKIVTILFAIYDIVIHCTH